MTNLLHFKIAASKTTIRNYTDCTTENLGCPMYQVGVIYKLEEETMNEHFLFSPRAYSFSDVARL